MNGRDEAMNGPDEAMNCCTFTVNLVGSCVLNGFKSRNETRCPRAKNEFRGRLFDQYRGYQPLQKIAHSSTQMQ